MKFTIAFIFAFLSTTVVYAETVNYSCSVDGKMYSLRVDDIKNVLEWRGKKYSLTVSEDCGKSGWHVAGNGRSFDFCEATQGSGYVFPSTSHPSIAFVGNTQTLHE